MRKQKPQIIITLIYIYYNAPADDIWISYFSIFIRLASIITVTFVFLVVNWSARLNRRPWTGPNKKDSKLKVHNVSGACRSLPRTYDSSASVIHPKPTHTCGLLRYVSLLNTDPLLWSAEYFSFRCIQGMKGKRQTINN